MALLVLRTGSNNASNNGMGEGRMHSETTALNQMEIKISDLDTECSVPITRILFEALSSGVDRRPRALASRWFATCGAAHSKSVADLCCPVER